MNLVFVNLLPFVLFALFDGYIMPIVLGSHTGIASPYVLFIMSLISVLPLVYYVGMGVACVSAQVRRRRGWRRTRPRGRIVPCRNGARPQKANKKVRVGRCAPLRRAAHSQSSFAIAAVVNATFGSIVEIVLYIMAVIAGKGA